MKRIQSFSVDHDKLKPGLYLSRVDGDAYTYDLRTRIPNGGDYMDHATMHSVEHLMATYLRNGPHADRILYFGPMGCQTGFYLVVRSLSGEAVKEELFRALAAIGEHTGPMPGSQRKECGNFANLSLEKGKAECLRYLKILQSKEITFQYEE